MPAETNHAARLAIKEAMTAVAALRKARKPVKAASDKSSEGVQEVLTEVEDAIEAAIETLESSIQEIKDDIED